MSVPEVGAFLSTTRISDPAEACEAVRALGFQVICQPGKLPESCYTPAGAEALGDILRQHGLTASLCVVFDGERYDDVESVAGRWASCPRRARGPAGLYTRRCIDTAAALGIPLVTFHMGCFRRPGRSGVSARAGAVDEWRRMRASKG